MTMLPPPAEQLLSLLRLLELQPAWVLLPAAVGFFRIAKLFLFLLRWAYAALLRPPRDLKRSYGSWALLTGPTGGIGEPLAFCLAARGLNLVLVDRDPDRLASVSASIRARHPGILLETVVLDLCAGYTGAGEGMRRIRELAEALDVGVAISNAGVSFPRPKYFHEVEETEWMEMVRVNLEGTTAVIRAVLPAMIKRGRGAVVSTGSASAGPLPSFPLYSVYAATKGYVDVLSRSLHLEYKDKGIHVQCQAPFLVATKMTERARRMIPFCRLIAVAPETYARAAVHWIGLDDAWCTPCWFHSLQSWSVWLLPTSIMNAGLLLINAQHS